MNEEELKALVGETAFKAMTADQVKASIAKFTPPPKVETKPPVTTTTTTTNEGDDLIKKAEKEKKEKEKSQSDSKSIESALSFTMGVENFVKDNKDLLPNEISDILKVADKEKYDSAVDKAAALKTAFIQSYFAVQSNMDLLTNSQKGQIEDYLKLTKTAKEEKSAMIYESVFEPAFKMFKEIKKATELAKTNSGFKGQSNVENAYVQRIIEQSNKKFGGKK